MLLDWLLSINILFHRMTQPQDSLVHQKKHWAAIHILSALCGEVLRSPVYGACWVCHFELGVIMSAAAVLQCFSRWQCEGKRHQRDTQGSSNHRIIKERDHNRPLKPQVIILSNYSSVQVHVFGCKRSQLKWKPDRIQNWCQKYLSFCTLYIFLVPQLIQNAFIWDLFCLSSLQSTQFDQSEKHIIEIYVKEITLK